MNLQTDNDMKRVILFFSLMLLLGNIKGLAQSIVIDPDVYKRQKYPIETQIFSSVFTEKLIEEAIKRKCNICLLDTSRCV